MNIAFKLYRLQQIDTLLDRSMARVAEIDEILADDSAVQEAQREASAKQVRLEKQQRRLRSAEFETKNQRDKIKSTETRLYSGAVKNPKELQDLERESAALKRYLAVLEERQLEAMLALDEAKSEAEISKAKLDDLQASQIENSAALRGEKSALEKDIKRLRDEREAALSGIAAGDLGLYDKLRSQRAGLAVAQVADKACAACGNTLNAALLQASKSPHELSRCSTCGRILYGN